MTCPRVRLAPSEGAAISVHHVAIPVADPMGSFMLEGRLEGEAGAPGVVVCHPHPAFGGTLDTPLVVALAAALARAGMLVLRFNFRGIGTSGGSPEGGLVEERDVRAACAFLRAHAQADNDLALAGYSFGALMALKALADGESARRCAAIGFPTAIVGEIPERITGVQRGLQRTDALFISGDRDQFSDLAAVRRWTAHLPSYPRLRLDERPGVGHFPTGAALDDIIARVTDFLAAPG